MRRARHVEVAGAVEPDADDALQRLVAFVVGAAEIGRVSDHRVDHERPGRVVRPEPDPDATLVVHDEVAGHPTPGAVDVLIHDGPRLTNVARRRTGHERAGVVDVHPLDAVERERDLPGIGTGSDDEVVFEPAPTAVVHEVDAGIDVDVLDGAVRRSRDGRRRSVATVVAHDARELAVSEDPWGRIAAEGPHPDDGAFGTAVVQRQHRFGRRQERRVARTAGHELHLRLGLAAVRLEDERTWRTHAPPWRHGRHRPGPVRRRTDPNLHDETPEYDEAEQPRPRAHRRMHAVASDGVMSLHRRCRLHSASRVPRPVEEPGEERQQLPQ